MNGLQQLHKEGNDEDEYDGDTLPMQAQGAAADLAMSVIIADAQTNNGGLEETKYQHAAL